MPKKALEDTLDRLKRDRQMAAQVEQWDGKVQYFSPRAAEKWETPEQLMSFQMQPSQEMRKVMTQYSQSLSHDLGLNPTKQVLADRKKRASFETWADPEKSRLTPFEAAYRVVDEDEPRKKRGFFGWLFGRKA